MTFRIKKYRELYVAEADSPLPRPKMKYRGEFRIVKHNEMGQVNYDSGWFPNLITNHGLDRLCYDNWRYYMQVGSGTTPAQFTDTALESKLPTGYSSGPGTPQTAVNNGAPNYEISQVESYYFPAGNGTGTTNEIGLSTGPSDQLSIRAIVPDPVTKASVEVMYIYHKVWMSMDLIDQTGQIVISGTAGGELYDYILRPMNVDATGQDLGRGWGGIQSLSTLHYIHAGDGDIGSITGTPSGTLDSSILTSTGVRESVDLVAHTAINRVYYGLSDGNFGTGIRCARVLHSTRGSSTYGWQLRVGRTSDDATIMKDSTQDINFAYQLSWNRV